MANPTPTMLAEVQAFRAKIQSLTNEQIFEKLGDERMSVLKRFDVRGTVNWRELICKAAWFLVFIILTMAVFFTCFSRHGSLGDKIVDGLYFGMVTFTTIGYGDIVPKSALAKAFTSLLMLFGALASNNLNKATAELLAWASLSHPHRMMVLAVLIGHIAVGALIALLTGRESIGTYPNGLYFAVTSVTGVGYGDFSWDGTLGRIFAFLWLLATCLFFHHAFGYVFEKVPGWILHYSGRGIQHLQDFVLNVIKFVLAVIKGVYAWLIGWLEHQGAPST